VHRLDRLISDISDASRLDAELNRASVEWVDLGALLGMLREIYGDPSRPEAPRLRLLSGEEGEFLVSGLEGRLAQVFRNLIENALSFSPPGGTVTLSLARDGEMIEAIVEDEGPGLPEGKFETIFERFYSERPAGEKFGTHSGLGLSISKRIVDVHGGTIRAENRRDRGGRVRGARFIVRLPMQTEGDRSQD
jgi:two-component system sensor histidine kinase ChvG